MKILVVITSGILWVSKVPRIFFAMPHYHLTVTNWAFVFPTLFNGGDNIYKIALTI